jgi:hypothetical protein
MRLVDGSGGSNAESEGEDGGEGEARRFAQLAQGEVEIGAQGGEHDGRQRCGSNVARMAVRKAHSALICASRGMFLVTTHHF